MAIQYARYRFSALIFAFLLTVRAAQSQAPIPPDSPLITNVTNRPGLSLDGAWSIIIDPYETGYYNYRYLPSENGFFKNQQPKTKADLVEYDFDADQRLNVPGDWNTQQEKLLLYEGTIWYKKSFDYAKKAGQRVFVHFGAVNYQAVVYLNGEKIGEHEGGFTPFNFEVTEKLKNGDNFLIVKVDNKRRRDAVPTLNTDWWNYGGITRSVTLLELPATFVKDYQLQLKKGTTDQIDGWVRLDGATRPQTVRIRIPEAGIDQSVTTGADGLARVQFKAKLTLWSPENPKLYTVQIGLNGTDLSDQIGFRSIETRGQDILLNGKSVFLTGICIHEEAPYRSGRAYTPDDARTLLGWAKDLGCNFVRLAHYPHNETMIREADRMGLLVWSEIPVYWTILWDNPATYDNAQRQLREMVTRDRNRASVILWSVANETPLSEPRLAFLSKLANEARALDNTRLITAALENHQVSPGVKMIDDPLGGYLDVIGNNNYCGWYAGEASTCGDLTWQTKFDKPLIMSEWGGGALQGLHGGTDERWTEEFQAAVYQGNIAMLKKIPFLRGTTPWLLMDFRSPKRPLARIQDYYNRKGLVSEQGIKKQAFYLLQDYYRTQSNTKQK